MRATVRSRTVSLGVLIAATSILSLLWVSGDAANLPANDPNDFAAFTAPLHPQVRRRILKTATGTFAPSLEMKENADFLLTPALLVQEAMAEDIVLTYPSE